MAIQCMIHIHIILSIGHSTVDERVAVRAAWAHFGQQYGPLVSHLITRGQPAVAPAMYHRRRCDMYSNADL